jgi:hypothetical protein
MKSILAMSLMLLCVVAWASGAPWYRWQNTVDKTIMCTQNSPGEFWVRYQGPFMESNCKHAGYPQ